MNRRPDAGGSACPTGSSGAGTVTIMADKQNPNDPQYDWLYSGPRQSDDDATQMIGRQEPDGPDQPDDDATQMIGRQEPDDSAAEHTRPIETQRGDPPPGQQPQSFGGTYAGANPPPSAQPLFATPAAQQGATGSGGPGQPSRSAQAPTPPKKRRRWWLRVVLIVLVAWLVFLIAVPVWTWKSITKVDAEPSGERPSETAGTTYLLVGSDSREDLTAEQKADLGTGSAAGQRTDTIILVHVPDNDGPTLILSIPRDSFVSIPGRGENKINAAYAFGGPDLLVQTVEQNTGVRVDSYVEVGFTGFVDIVDAVGGIQVCPKSAIEDPKAGNLKLAAGCQGVDGHTALSYSRSRAFPNGDITRALHQREVITAVGSKAASWQTVVLPWRYVKVNRAAADTLHVGEDVGPVDLATFAWAMAHANGSDAKRCVVPYSDLGATTSAGSSVIWDEAKAKALFALIRQDQTAEISCAPQ